MPLPIGVPGDLYLSGAGLARGYLHRPDLTAERFLPDPFSDEPGMRLYYMGDQAWYLSDGSLEFLGRADQQVKLRGYRIELGEIEAALAQHPTVRQGVVAVREETAGNKFLVAYVIPGPDLLDAQPGGQTLTSSELLTYLQKKLPGYMQPSAVVFLPTLPLTPNGKIDWQALPGPQLVAVDVPESATESRPLTPVEEILVDIWAEVLGLELIGVFDNFFALGGHSLLATQVIARVCTLFQVDLSVLTLFEAPTVASFAESLIEDEPVPGQIMAMARVRLKLKHMSPQEVRQR